MSNPEQQEAQLEAAVRAAEAVDEGKKRAADSQSFTRDPDMDELDRLAAYDRGIEYRSPSVERDDDYRRGLLRDVLARIAQDDEYDLQPLTGMGKGAFRIVSLRARREHEAATQALRDAGRALTDFRETHRVELDAIKTERAHQRVADALESGDAEKIREILGLGPSKALTTDALSG